MLDFEYIKEDQKFITEKGTQYYFTHDYCLCIYGIKLRDLKGRDLTYTDWMSSTLTDEYIKTLGFVTQFLKRFICIEDGYNPDILDHLNIEQLTEVFNVYVSKVIRPPIVSRDSWMNCIYHLSGDSYGEMSNYEDVPLTEILFMIQSHNEYQEKIKQEHSK